MKRKIVSALLAGVIVAGTSYQAFATPISDGQKEKIENTRNEYNDLNSKINKLNEELIQLSAQMNPLYIAKEENDSKIATIKGQISETEAEIPVIEAKIKEKQEVLGKRISGVYKSGGQMNYLSLLLSSDNLGDFLGNVNAISTLMKIDNQVIEEIEVDKKELNDKIEVLNTQKAEIDKLNAENEAKLAQFKQLEDKQKEVKAQYDEELKNVKVDLTAAEMPLAQPLVDVINNSSSSKDQIQNAVNSLKGLKNQIVSTQVKSEIDSAIAKGNNRIVELTPPPVVSEVGQGSSGNSSTGSVSSGGSGNGSTGAESSSGSNSGEGSGSNSNGGQVVAPPASGSTVDRIIASAYAQIGKPYVYGATGPNAFDCSGFTQYVYRQAGVSISRTTTTQVREGRYVPQNQLQPGDLVFTEGTASNPSHVGLYIGNGQMIHAPRTGDVIKVAPVYKFITARRIL